MSTMLRWITGSHVFLGAWIFMGYVVWWEINNHKGSAFWMYVRITISSIITIGLLALSLNLMGKTYLIPRVHPPL